MALFGAHQRGCEMGVNQIDLKYTERKWTIIT